MYRLRRPCQSGQFRGVVGEAPLGRRMMSRIFAPLLSARGALAYRLSWLWARPSSRRPSSARRAGFVPQQRRVNVDLPGVDPPPQFGAQRLIDLMVRLKFPRLPAAV